MNNFKLRIDLLAHDESITKGIKKYAYVQEKVDTNPHIHYRLETDLKRATIIQRVKKLPGYHKGNAFYSLRELKPDDDGYLRYDAYLRKEGKPTYVGYSEEDIKEIKEFDSKIKEEIKEKKLSKRTALQKIESAYFTDVKEGIDVKRDEYVTKEYVVDCVLEFYKQQGTLVREFFMVSLCQTLCLKYVPSYTVSFKRRLLDKI